LEISSKAISTGLVFSFIASIVLSVALGFFLAMAVGSEAAIEMVRPSDGGFSALEFFLASIIAVASGYVAARVAGRGELINGALANAIRPAFAVILGLAIAPDGLVICILYLVILPLFGMLGGYIRLKQIAEYA
jgi:hypothetical protein